METTANYTRVGGFVLGGFCAFLILIVWLSQIDFGHQRTMYEIQFTGSVTGLKKGATVQYRGVPIGNVDDIRIPVQDVEKIHVFVMIDAHVPIKQDAYATLETQGITGVSLIQIHGGSHDSPLIPSGRPGQPYPIIPSQSSLYEKVAGSLPEILVVLNGLVQDLRLVFSQENQRSIAQVLRNLEEISDTLASQTQSSALKNGLSAFEAAMKQIQGVSQELHQLFTNNRDGFRSFTTSTLPALDQFLQEGREAFVSLRRLSDTIEHSPTRFFYNDTKQGVLVP